MQLLLGTVGAAATVVTNLPKGACLCAQEPPAALEVTKLATVCALLSHEVGGASPSTEALVTTRQTAGWKKKESLLVPPCSLHHCTLLVELNGVGGQRRTVVSRVKLQCHKVGKEGLLWCREAIHC